MLLFSCVQFFMTPWNVVHQAPLSMGFPRQEYWSGSPFPSPRDLPNQEIEPASLALQVDSLSLIHLGSLHLPLVIVYSQKLLDVMLH